MIKFKDGKILFKWESVKQMNLNEAETKAIGQCGKDTIELKDVEDGMKLFQWHGAEEAYFDETGSMVIVYYKDGRAEIIDSENGEAIFEGVGIREIDLDQLDMKAVVHYEGGRTDIINLKDKTTIFTGNNIAWLRFNPTGTRVFVQYKSNKAELIDFEDCNRDTALAKLGPKKLRFIFSLKKLNSPDTIADFVSEHYSVWGSFDADLKQKLLQSYFSEAVKVEIVKTETRIMKKRRIEEDGPEIPRKKHKKETAAEEQIAGTVRKRKAVGSEPETPNKKHKKEESECV